MQLRFIASTTACLCLTALSASATTFDLANATGVVTPTFRGAPDTTFVAWDTFGIAGDPFIDDSTPDIGVGRFVTTNGNSHRSGSGNYYSGGDTVAEEITFVAPGAGPEGYTTVIVQAVTLFGGWSVPITFGPIDGVAPLLTVFEPSLSNAAGAGQFFVKYEVPGVVTTPTFSISSDPGHTSMGYFTVDALWSPTAYSTDSAIHTPEPTSGVIVLAGLAGLLLRRRS